ncbi:MAG TPA: hypothetical protein VG963_15625 [Polyangiaceae bacterium]|nr:hypothetical protein [Polyangiaceae bacterium]
MHAVRVAHQSGRAGLAAAVVASISACGAWSEPGVSVTLLAEPSAAADAGIPGLELFELRWTSSEIELQACPGLVARAKDWLLPSAFAHGTSNPLRLAVPTVLSALGGPAIEIGELAPPGGSYCAVRYHVAPADDDAEGLLNAPAMRGMSLDVRGAFVDAGGVEQTFEILSQRTLDVSLPLELELSASRPRAHLVVRSAFDHWPSGREFAALASDQRERAAWQAFQASLEVSAE